MAKILATTVRAGSGRLVLLVEASDGKTYVREGEMFRGKVRYSYSVMPTVVDRSRPLSENVDSAVALGSVPVAVRRAFATVAP